MKARNGTPETGRLDRIAEAISAVLHPFVVVVPTMVIAMYERGASLSTALLWTVLAILIVIGPLVFLIYSGVRSGRYSDAAISIREQRRTLYIVAGALMALLIVVLVLGKAPRVLLACLVAAILATFIAFVINSRFTKLSLHSIGLAGCAIVLLLLVPPLGIAAALSAPLLAWARIHLKHHTPVQILLGWMDAAVCVLLVFRLFRLP